MEWIKFYTAKWLYGSGRTMTPEKRGVWADLLALAAETKLRDGTLRFDVGLPMPRNYIAGILMIERELLDACLAAFVADINTDDGKPRVSLWEDGTIELTNFKRFQAIPSKTEGSGDIPLSPEDKKASQQAAAARLGYLQPDAARRGVKAREFEESTKHLPGDTKEREG